MEFKLTDEQQNKINEWAYNHECPITAEGACGGKITYQFTPTSLGMVEKGVCACGAECSVTDYELW